MTTKTTIPVSRAGNTGSPDGPIDCARCGLSIVDREPDEIDPGAGDYSVHTWIHDTGDGDLAICDDCQDQSEQSYAWAELVRWQSRAPIDREIRVRLHSVYLWELGRPETRLEAQRGQLDVAEVTAFVSRDPPKFDLMAGDECPPTERNFERAIERAEGLIGGMR